MSAAITSHEEVLGVLVGVFDGAAVASDVADEMSISASTARRYLDDMAKRGWVTKGRTVGGWHRLTHVTDYTVTDRGREAHHGLEGW